MDWKPKAHILTDTPQAKPTKTTKSVFDVFVGPAPAAFPKIEAPEIPPIEAWPSSLRELAEERAPLSFNSAATPEEVWISYHEWKARELSRLLDECVIPGPGRKPCKITAETVRDGIDRATKEKGKS